MKKNFSKITVLLVAFVLMICSVAAISVSAEEAAPASTLKVDSANVVYGDVLYSAFTISGKAPAGATAVGIMTWPADEANPTAQNKTHYELSKTPKEYYKSAGIPATELDVIVKVAACYQLGGQLYVSGDIIEWSIAKYAGKRLLENPTLNQAKLYEDLIEYAIASDDVLESETNAVVKNYAFVQAVNGTIENEGAKIGGWAGASVLLRADAINPDGKYFTYWADAEGNPVSYNRLHTVTAPEAGVDTYTAVFGAQADSMYAITANLEAEPNGNFGNIVHGTITSDRSGGGTVFNIVEEVGGNKEIYCDRVGGTGNPNIQLTTVPAGAVGFEFDLAYESYTKWVNQHYITLNIKDANGTAFSIRLLNSHMNSSGYVNYTLGKHNNYTGDTINLTKNAQSASYRNYAEEGVATTYGFVLVPYTKTVDEATVNGFEVQIWINGELFNTYDMTDFSYLTCNANYATSDFSSYTITSASISSYKDQADDYRLDNISYFTEYKK